MSKENTGKASKKKMLSLEESPSAIQIALVDLYLNVKVRSTEEIAAYNKEQNEQEKQELLDLDPFLLIKYIKSSIEILMNLKIEEQQYYLKMQKEEEDTASVNTSHSRADPPHDYEVLLQNLESEVRNHIRIEQQLKLHIDHVQGKVDDSDKLKIKMEDAQKKMQNDISELKDQLKSKEIENSKLRKEMEKYKTELKALEERLNDADKVFRGSKAFENKTYDASDTRRKDSKISSKGSPHRMNNGYLLESESTRAINTKYSPRTLSTGHLRTKITYDSGRNKSGGDPYKDMMTKYKKELAKQNREGNRKQRGEKEEGGSMLTSSSIDFMSKMKKNNTMKNNPYIAELYKKQLEDKNSQLLKLKHKFNQLQKINNKENTVIGQNTGYKEGALTARQQTSSFHQRSKSHKEDSKDEKSTNQAQPASTVISGASIQSSHTHLVNSGIRSISRKGGQRSEGGLMRKESLEKNTTLHRMPSTEAILNSKTKHHIAEKRPMSTYRERSIGGPTNREIIHSSKGGVSTSGIYSKYSNSSKLIKVFNNTYQPNNRSIKKPIQNDH